MLIDYINTSTEQMASNHQQTSNMLSAYPSHHQQVNTVGVNIAEPQYFYQNTDPSSVGNRQNFSLNPATAPLAALHSMTEIKTSQPQTSGTPYNSAAYYSSMKNSMLNAAATSHNITDILSRPDLQAQLQARLGQGMYYNSCSQGTPVAPAGPANLSPTTKDMTSGGSNSLYWPPNSQLMQSHQPAGGWHHKHGRCI